MKKTINIFERILRIILLVVACALIVTSIVFVSFHLSGKGVEKTPVQGLVVRGTDFSQIKKIKYNFEGKTFEERPLDTYLKKLGNIGDKITIYVEKKEPKHTFVTENGDYLLHTAGLMAGWGVLLLAILVGEYQLLSKMKKLEKNQEK